LICDVPLRIVQALLSGCIIYWIVGLNPSAAAFFIFCCILIVEGLASQGLGVAVSAGAPNERVAMALAPAITIVMILFGGFYVNEGAHGQGRLRGEARWRCRWAAWADVTRPGEGGLFFVSGPTHAVLFTRAGSIPDWLAWIKWLSHLYYAFMALTINDFGGRYGWACEQPGSVPPECKTGDQIIESLGFNPSELWLGFVGLFSLLVGFNSIGYVLLRRSKPKFMPLTEVAHPKKAQ
jgi:hypothetical protein